MEKLTRKQIVTIAVFIVVVIALIIAGIVFGKKATMRLKKIRIRK